MSKRRRLVWMTARLWSATPACNIPPSNSPLSDSPTPPPTPAPAPAATQPLEIYSEYEVRIIPSWCDTFWREFGNKTIIKCIGVSEFR
ncbi:hypothetical protein F4823DRAFT_585281 [Ustulina deusta]|nr:hypothetical protein F4823DRAFT_585281 [Ustulina deusta]